MVKTENENKSISVESSDEASSIKTKQKNQGKKRKRCSSESSNDEIILPDNALETERNVHASAVKNNLDETSVRKIIKRVVTNDHVLALVQLREEEENSRANDKKLQPKLTRAKVKELKKVSPKSRAWNLENLELTPINHIPVKTRPEVKALIAQELPEDEDDEEYEPTHDDVQSDDEHTESCSDLDSQPRTPATPASLHADSPRVVKDGPFKVPQDVSSARRKLDIEEEATIALRTRSKLSLSATSIEHIESTFIPPDDLPIQDVDDLWNQFLNECLNPASTTKHEDDDETDPEYNVAADADTNDEDDETLNSLFKISKKELNDLVTELFNIMPEANDDNLAENLANSVLTDNSQTEISPWEGKQELLSDDENGEKHSKNLTVENNDCSRLSLGKNVPEDVQDTGNQNCIDKQRRKEKGNEQSEKGNAPKRSKKSVETKSTPHIAISSKNNKIEISIEERNTQACTGPEAPPSLRSKIKPALETVHIKIDPTVTITPEQLLILQQQIRQHVQLATSNFMQLVVHPVHWKLAPTYKEYLTSLKKLADAKESSVVNVCNLKPAYELVTMWEKSVSADTAENRKMIEYIQSEVDRSRRRMAGNSLYVGEFHETFKKVVCNSPVFLYPYLLPGMPYRPDATRRFCYLHSEDVLIVLGLDQFWQYVDSNPQLYKLYKARAGQPRGRRGLKATLELVTKHLLPWMSVRTLAGHVHGARAAADPHNPIYRFFKYNEVPKTEHRILPYNPKISLYEQPEHEIPKIWVRYLAKTSKRFRNYLHKRPTANGRPPDGVPIDPGLDPNSTIKRPLPIDFTKEIISHRSTLNDKPLQPNLNDKFDIQIQSDNQTSPSNSINNNAPTENSTLVAQNFYRLVETSTGAYLLPLQVNTQTVNSNMGSITTPVALGTTLTNTPPETQPKRVTYNTEHCMCCVLLREICKKRQTFITEYFKSKEEKRKICDCNSIRFPKISNRLKLLVRNNKKISELVFQELEKKLKDVASDDAKTDMFDCDSKDLAYVLGYQLKVFTRASMSRRIYVKKRVRNLLSRFNIDSGDPTKLALDLFKAFDVELVDLYLDFLGFLTPDQADRLEVFRDYFTRNCAEGLMRKVEEEVSNKSSRLRILSQLKQVVSDSKSSSCELCRSLLDTMREQPGLARYTFHLFPHRKETRTQICTTTVEPAKCADAQKDANDTTCDEPHNTVDYEADHSSCGEDSDAISEDLTVQHGFGDTHEPSIKAELPADDQEDPFEGVSKIEAEDCDSDTSMTYEANTIKFEDICEWKRDEDKIVLQVLQEQLTPEERKEISIIELLEDKNVYTIISDSLTERSLEQIKDRVMYLLSMLVLNDSSRPK